MPSTDEMAARFEGLLQEVHSFVERQKKYRSAVSAHVRRAAWPYGYFFAFSAPEIGEERLKVEAQREELIQALTEFASDNAALDDEAACRRDSLINLWLARLYFWDGHYGLAQTYAEMALGSAMATEKVRLSSEKLRKKAFWRGFLAYYLPPI